MPILKVQQTKATEAMTSTLNLSLPETPTEDNTLVAVIGTRGAFNWTVMDVEQTGVTWTRISYNINTSGGNGIGCDIWKGIIGSNASPDITITVPYTFSRITTNIFEYSGLTGSYDKTTATNGTGTTITTGTTSTTSASEELWIGATVGESTQSSLDDGFTLIDGNQEGSAGNALSVGYLEKITLQTGQATTGTTQESSSNWVGIIATFLADVTTVNVKNNELYSGSGSKQTIIYSTADPIIDVESNFGEWDKSAVIENLIICGDGTNTAIRLEDVYNCKIRNVSIVNCATGIDVEASNNKWCESNNFSHIRMLYVDKGIVFKCSTDASFSYTTIDDVFISLDNENGIGIQVGDGTAVAMLNSSFIKATCWVNSDYSTGIKIYGQIKNGITNLRLEDASAGANNTKGVDLQCSDYAVYDNHSFFVTYGNLDTPPTQENIPEEFDIYMVGL